METFVDLKRLIGPPEWPPMRCEWGVIEAALGLRLPTDYKQLFDTYRDLNFDDFLGIFHPGENPERNRDGVVAALDSLRSMIEVTGGLQRVAVGGDSEGVVHFFLYPEPEGLLPWGNTWNGDLCLWHTIGDDPNLWPIVITDTVDFWEFSGTISEFLIGIMNRSIRCPIFPEDFPSSGRVIQTNFPSAL